jgi:cytochrome P450
MDQPPSLDIEHYLTDPTGELRRCAGQGWYAAAIDEQGGPLPIVLAFDRVKAVLRDRRLSPQSFPQDMISRGLSVETTEQFTPLFRRHGEEHRFHRGLLAAAFTPRQVERLRPLAAGIAAQLADGIAAAGGDGEFVADFADPLPPQVFAHLFGLAEVDWSLLSRWAATVAVAFSPTMSADHIAAIEAVGAEMRDWSTELIAQRRAAPADDLVTRLIEVEDGGNRLNDPDIVAIISAFVFAGTETTKRQTTEMLRVFAEQPQAWTRLQHEPELVATAVEEVLRFRPIVPGLTRVAVEDFDLEGLEVPAHCRLAMSFLTANHDAAVFDDPDTFDVARPNADQHLTFGWGPHLCLGAGLARVELQEALRALLARFGPPVIVGDAGGSMDFGAAEVVHARFPLR